MTDMKKVIKGLEKVSYYFKSMLRVGYQGNADIYREHRESIKMAIALLKEQTAVVRCKDCKYYDNFNGCMSWHDVNSNNDNWYCADGERRIDDG